jgi:hypothetical protein
MLSNTPALSADPVEITAGAASPIAQWGEMALTVMFTLAGTICIFSRRGHRLGLTRFLILLHRHRL